MKKFLNMMFAIAVVICMMCPSFIRAAEIDDVPESDKQIAKRTVLLYLCGTDLETNEGAAAYNLRQILRSYFSSDDDVRFVIMTGGTNDWTLEKDYLLFPDDVNVPEDAVYLIDEEKYADPKSDISNVYNQIWEAKGLDAENPEERGKMILLDGDGILGDGDTAKRSMIRPEDYVTDEDDWEIFDIDKIGNYEWMNDPEVLKAFINFGVENYPAEKYDLILWDHGSGPDGFCNNEQEYLEATDTMTVPEIMDALLNNNYVDPDGDGVVDNKFDILDFDACLMGSTEVILALADFCDYFIGSPEPEPNYGQDYEGWLNMVGATPDVDTYELSKKIVDDFIAFYDKEYGDGSDEEATLAFFNTEKLLNTKINDTTFVEALTSFNRILNEEILGTKYHDEFRAFRDCLTYGIFSYYDLGVLASQLAYLYDDIDLDDLTPDGKVNNKSSYTASAGVIQGLLNDEEIVYARETKGFFTKPQYYRDADGTIKYGKQGSSGLHLTFDSSVNPFDPYEHYYPDMKAAAAKIEEQHKGGNDHRPQFLREFIETSWKLGFAHYTGSTVTQMIADGVDKDDITYETVKEYWQTVSGSLGYLPWDFICKDYVKAIGGEEVAKGIIEGWISEMINESISEDDIDVQPLKKKNTDAGVITFNNVKKQAIESVQANIIAELPAVRDFVNDPAHEDYLGYFKDVSPKLKIGSLNGSEIIDVDPEAEGYEAAVNWLFEPTSKWELDLPELKGYALKDAEGTLHVTNATPFASFLEVPAGYWATELREEYDWVTDTSKLVMKEVWHGVTLLFRKNDQGEWRVRNIIIENDTGISRNISAKEYTKSMELYTAIYLEDDFDLRGVPISKTSFIISPETLDKVTIEYVDIDEIPKDVKDTDGDGRAVHSTVIAKNIYGYSLDITDKVQKATAAELTHIEYARIRPGVLTGGHDKELVPELVYQGKTLAEGVDYLLRKVNSSDKFNKAGAYEVKVTGKGLFAGTADMIFNIVLPEDEAAQAVEDARDAVIAAQAEVDALADDATAEEIKAAYEKLVKAQYTLTDAQEALQRTKTILSAEEKAKLEDEIEKLEKDIQDLNDQLAEAQVIDISNYAATLAKTTYQYTGKAIEPAVSVSGLKASDYTVTYSNNKKIGTATVIIKAKGKKYTGQIKKTFKIIKKSNTLTVKGKKVTVKYKKLKKKKRTLKISKVITFTKKGQGTRSYKKVSGNKKITINKKTGKVTVKKGLKKGTYKVKVKVRAAGNSIYAASAWKAVTFRIKVK